MSGGSPARPRSDGLPSAWRVLAVCGAAAPVAAAINAGSDMLLNRLEGGPASWWFSWTHLLPPWLVLAALAAVIVPFVRRFPLPQPRPAAAIAAHVGAGLAFPLASLTMVDLLHVAFAGAAFSTHLAWLLASEYIAQLPVFAAIAGVLHAMRHVRVQRALRDEALRLRAELAEARFDALSRQMQPHFLFNALNAVAMLARSGDTDGAVETLARLGEVIRALLRERPHGDAALADELALVESYLALEGVRLGDRLRVEIACDPTLRDLTIPFLTLQPLVENAIRHGVSKRAGESALRISAVRHDGGVRLRVEEGCADGRPRPPGSGGSTRLDGAAVVGVGLTNTRARLAARYGEAARLTLFVDGAGGGSVAEVELPVTRTGP